MDTNHIRLKKKEEIVLYFSESDSLVFKYRYGEIYRIAPVDSQERIKGQLHVQLEERPGLSTGNRFINFEIDIPYEFVSTDFDVLAEKTYKFFLEGLSGMEVIEVKRLQ